MIHHASRLVEIAGVTEHPEAGHSSVEAAARDCLRLGLLEDPAEWFPKLANLRATGAVDEVMVALPAEIAATQFKALVSG